MLAIAGLLWGVTLGAFIQRECGRTNAKAAWLKWMKLLSLLIAISIGVGILIGQADDLNLSRLKAEIWDANHKEIIRLRDAGDSSVYSKSFEQVYLVCGSRPTKYKRLKWYERAFYNLEYSLNESKLAPKDTAASADSRQHSSIVF